MVPHTRGGARTRTPGRTRAVGRRLSPCSGQILRRIRSARGMGVSTAPHCYASCRQTCVPLGRPDDKCCVSGGINRAHWVCSGWFGRRDTIVRSIAQMQRTSCSLDGARALHSHARARCPPFNEARLRKASSIGVHCVHVQRPHVQAHLASGLPRLARRP
ncbi:hypothetical protein BC834DRAFT_521211 [Gloeopeniophorella convolvens]|nr:hypothetical protein BC834DRAFT_521211 [Gloeopeniophorella convolvens]